MSGGADDDEGAEAATATSAAGSGVGLGCGREDDDGSAALDDDGSERLGPGTESWPALENTPPPFPAGFSAVGGM